MSDDLVKRLRTCRDVDQRREAADRIEALTAKCELLGQQVNMAKYGQPDFAWSIHKAAMSDLQAENARLRVALSRISDVEQGCGGSMSFKEMAESAVRQARLALSVEKESSK
jgi:hypothetical protein